MRKQLHLGARWLFRISGYFGALFLMIFLSWFIIPFLSVLLIGTGIISAGTAVATILLFGVLYIFAIIMIIMIAEIYARMSYNRWFYEFTEDNLKIEKGIIWKKYSNVPYERVQNVDITRGVIARLCGFSTVNIQTAGFSYTGRGMPSSEGYLPAVTSDEAEKVRDFLMKKISKKGRRQGL